MSTSHNTNIIAVVVGATIGVISVATAFIYNKILEQQQHRTMNNSIDRVNREVSKLKADIEELRAQQVNLQKSRKRKLIKRQVYSNDNTYTGTEDIDTYSIAGTDLGDDEFFDCSDNEDINGDVENGINVGILTENPEILELYAESEWNYLHPVVYHKFKKLVEKNPDDVEAVWRFARTCYHLSVQGNNSEEQKNLILEGCEACEKLLNVCNCNLYKWYAILIGSKSKTLPTKSKIENGYLFKEYVDKALELNPLDGLLHHLMGRFKYEVSELSWIERKVASTLYAEVPTATYEDAIEYFEKAENLIQDPHYENKLFLGKSYIKLGNYKEGMHWLKQISKIDAKTDEENKIQSLAKKLVMKYSDYCR